MLHSAFLQLYRTILVIRLLSPTCNGVSDGNTLQEFPMLANVTENSIVMRPCLMVNRNTSGNLIFDFDKSAAAVSLALRYVTDYVLPDNVIFNVTVVNLGPTCPDKSMSVDQAMQQREREGRNCTVYIGPGCTSAVQSLYDYAAYYAVPIIGLPGDGMGTLADMTEYPFLSRISMTHTNTAYVINKFLSLFNYTNAFFIAETSDDFYLNLYMVATTILRNSDPRFQYTMKFRSFSAAGAGSVTVSQQIQSLLMEAQLTTRVIFLMATGPWVRQLMVTAAGMKMTSSEYVYLAVELFSSKSFGRFTWDYQDPSDEVAKDAFESLLLIAYKPQINSDFLEFQREVIQHSPEHGYTYRMDEKVDAVAGHFYDAIVFYASVLSQLAAAGLNVTDGTIAANLSQSYFSFVSPINGFLQLDSNGDRHSDYVVTRLSRTSRRFEPFLDCPDVLPDCAIVGSVQWREENHLPFNEPKCGYRGEHVSCQPIAARLSVGGRAAAIVVPILLLLVIIFGATRAIRRYIDSRSDPYWWRVYMHEFIGIHTGGAQSNLTSTTGKSSKHSKDRLEVVDEEKMSFTSSSLTNTIHIHTAMLDGNYVQLIELPDPKLRAAPILDSELKPLRRIQNANVQTFLGIAVSDENICTYVIGEACQKGTLESMLRLDVLKLDDPFKFSFINDLIMGMSYLHASNVVSHGNLTDTTCLIDSRFMLKISGQGLGRFRSDAVLEAPFEHQEERDFLPLLWRAPELLRAAMPEKGTVRGDVYSFAILLQQIVLVMPPYGTNPAAWLRNNAAAKEIVLEVKRGTIPALRPRVPRLSCPDFIRDLMDQCWDEDPPLRPSFMSIQEDFRKVTGFLRGNVIDHLVKRMEEYAQNLEERITESVKRFMEEKKRSEEILYSILPRHVAQLWNSGMDILPETYPSTTVYYSVLHGWENIVTLTRNPRELTHALNAYYELCDGIIEGHHDAYKVEVASETYMIVSGLPISNGTLHVDIIASISLDILQAVNGRSFTSSFSTTCQMRIGISSGPCVAAVIGLKMPKYCLFGDTVYTASRMQLDGEPGKIHMSSAAQDILQHYRRYDIEYRGERDIKGKGPMRTYWLRGLLGSQHSKKQLSSSIHTHRSNHSARR